MRPRLSIRTKLILSISIPLLITYLSLLTWDYQRQRALAVKDLQDALQQRVDGLASALDARLTQIAQLSQLVSRPLETHHGDVVLRAAATNALRNPWVVGVTAVFDDGSGPVAKTVASEGENFRFLEAHVETSTTPDWYDHTQKQGATGWTGGRWVTSSRGAVRRRVSTYYAPIKNGDQTIGAVGLDVALETLRRFGPRGGGGGGGPRGGGPDSRGSGPDLLGGPIGPPPGEPTSRPADTQRSGEAPRANDPLRNTLDPGRQFDDFLLFDGQGELLNAPVADLSDAHLRSLYEDAEVLHEPALAEAAKSAYAGESQVLLVDNLKSVMPSVGGDTRHWLALAPIRTTGWVLATAMPESDRMQEVNDRLLQRAVFLSVGSILMLVIVWVVAIRISRPIELLARGVDQVASGDLAVTVPDTGAHDELGRLSRGFNHMTAQIRQHVAEIRATTTAHERVQGELRVARQIQIDLLPKTFPPFPDRKEFDLHALNLSALQVAGDFYDFFFSPGDKLTMVIADVSGKGVPAALLMAVTRTLVRNLAMSGMTPAHIAAATNRALMDDSPRSMFVTMVICQYDTATGELAYVNCGHPPPVLLKTGEEPRPISNEFSPLLGVDDSGQLGEFTQQYLQLHPGETVLLYTDGVSESPAPGKDLLGTDGLIDLLRTRTAESPQQLCLSLADTLRGYQGKALADDLTMLALRRVL